MNWDSFKWRNHQPDIGRFFNVDPLAEDYMYNSPYAFSENKVTSHVEIEGLESQTIHESSLKREVEKVERVIMHEVSLIKKLFEMPEQTGKTEIEKKNEKPIAVDEDQREKVKPTETPTGELDGNLNPLYNPNGTAKGGDPEAKQVMTQEGSHMKVENPDKPGSASYDTTWTGRGEHVFDNKADTIKGEAIVNGDTMMVIKKIKKH